jgi:predicted nucleic-acid-binding Zn-ribbon protein
MNEKEVMKCPKCGGELAMGRDLRGAHFNSIYFRKPEDWGGDKIIPFCCKKCGYIELYNEKNLETKQP